MWDFFFRSFVKKLERSARVVSQDFVKSAGKEVMDLVDYKLSPLADKFDYIAQKRTNQLIDASIELENKCKADIESLLNNADGKAKEALERVDQVREDAIRDLRETIGQTDLYLENRINQISLVMMEALNSTQGITETTFTSIDNVLKTYGQLQLNAARMAALVKNAPELKRRAIEDWLKYGVLT